jgi:hypothetical protein
LSIGGLPLIFSAMTPLLDLPDVRERVHRLSVSDYHRLGESGVIAEDV